MKKFLLLGLLLSCSTGFAQMEQPEPFPFKDICAWVKVKPPVDFHGKKLEEIPDIREPILRLANQLLSTGCFGQADKRLQDFFRKYPDNPHAKYVQARTVWWFEGIQPAETLLREVLRDHPDFVSAKVLLAGILLVNERYADGRRLIDEVGKKAPTDVWVYLNRLELEAREKPSRALRTRLLEIAKSDAFPPNAREGAISIGIDLPGQSNDEVEEFMWACLDFQSVADVSEVWRLANRLSEVDERFEQARELLESEHARSQLCREYPRNNILLAQAYLMKAASIAPTPTAANEALIEKATVALHADYPALREYVADRPQAKVLAPFLDYRPKPEVADAEGRTPLCNAVRDLSIEGTRDLIDRGANPNGLCAGRTMMGHVMYVDTEDRNRQRQAIVRMLMSQGGEPTREDSESLHAAEVW